MKRTLLIYAILLFSILLFSQNENPYSEFGYKAPVMYNKKIKLDGEGLKLFYIFNTDTSSEIRWLTINIKYKRIYFFSKESVLIFSDTILNHKMARWLNPDPMKQYNSPYLGMGNNPVSSIDPTGCLVPWYEDQTDGNIEWHDNDDEARLSMGEGNFKNLGNNVIVAYNNRDINLHENINSAIYFLYLESYTSGPSAIITGNTISADLITYGTIAEGIYPAKFQGRTSYLARGIDDLAVLLNNGEDIPTERIFGYGPNYRSSVNGVFLHNGNNYQMSLSDSRGIPYSKACQTTGNYSGSSVQHNNFMQIVGRNFDGNYYLRPRISTNTLNFGF